MECLDRNTVYAGEFSLGPPLRCTLGICVPLLVRILPFSKNVIRYGTHFRSELIGVLPGTHICFFRQFLLLQQNLTFENFYSLRLAFPSKSLAFGVLSRVLKV